MSEQHPGLRDRPIYLDYNATTPIDPQVFAAMTPYLTVEFGNPSSDHAYGQSAHRAMDQARSAVAALVGAAASEIIFTGSGSEADALAIRGAVLAARAAGTDHPHVITQVTEHPAVLAACRDLEVLHHVAVTYLPVDATGRVDPGAVEAAMTPDTVLVSIMHANNETGTIQAIADIATITRARGILLHTDAAQSVGKITVDVDDLGVDLLTVVGHKMYAPKGIAALYVRTGVHLHPVVAGGGQEHGLRAGTENVAYAVGLGRAADLAVQALAGGETARLTALRDLLEQRLRDHLPGRVHLNGHPTERLPNTLNVRITGAPALALLDAMPAVAASAGSACHAGRDEPSPVLTAMGLHRQDALSALRLSLGRWSTSREIEAAAAAIAIATPGPS
ncbi:cysteine desulfurase family protein [Cellulomonas sp. P24]|uniref:cysteine desulfurase family protein n=1 Tax=Cellulomonas sp. P24 TaxID=2885206 RepID=UPI00216AE156|nr:cysteine desulfurase family protein [Cellulomonas sp. P24]MCR6494453.1 cysteine desulfurase [Cellulomonas sp. P24]